MTVPRIAYDEVRLPRLAHAWEDVGAILPRDVLEQGVELGASASLTHAHAHTHARMDALWLTGFLDAASHTRMERAKARGNPFRTTALDVDDLRAREVSENARDRTLESEFQRLVDAVALHTHADADARARGVSTRSLHQNPLTLENARIRHVLQSGRSSSAPQHMHTTAMDRLLLLQRLEVQAAIILQRGYRRRLRRRFWRIFAHENRAATKIQAVWVGYLDRCRYKQYRAIVTRLALWIQAHWRGAMVRKTTREDHAFDSAAAVDIQRALRGALARILADKLRRDRHATKIQAWWRGCRGRAIADRRYFDAMATRIQRLVRGVRVRTRYAKERAAAYEYAIRIQRAMRGWLARRLRDRELWERESNLRKHWVRIYIAEARWQEEHVEQLKKKVLGMESNVSASDVTDEWRTLSEDILRLERDYVCLIVERDAMGPEADEAWAARFQENETLLRRQITAAKRAALFETALKARTSLAKLRAAREQHADVAYRLESLERQIVDERTDTLKRDMFMQHAKARKQERHDAANERRKWKVQAITQTGKPDLAARAQEAAHDLEFLIKKRRAPQDDSGAIRLGGALAGGHALLLMDAQFPGEHSQTLSLTRSTFVGLLGSSIALPQPHGTGGATLRNPQSGFTLQSQASTSSMQSRTEYHQQQAAMSLRQQIAAKMAEYDRKYGNLFGADNAGSTDAPLDYDDPRLQGGNTSAAISRRTAAVLQLDNQPHDAAASQNSDSKLRIQRVVHQEWHRNVAGEAQHDVLTEHTGLPPNGLEFGGLMTEASGKHSKSKPHVKLRPLRSIVHDEGVVRRFGGGQASEDDAGRLGGSYSRANFGGRPVDPSPVEHDTPPAIEGTTADAAIIRLDGRQRHESRAAAAAVAAYGSRQLYATVKTTALQRYEAEITAMIADDAAPALHQTVERLAPTHAPAQQKAGLVRDSDASPETQTLQRVHHLINALGVVSGDAEMLQYGALLKPAMQTMSDTMMNLLASDATAGAVERVGQQMRERVPAIREKLQRLRKETIYEEASEEDATLTSAELEETSTAVRRDPVLDAAVHYGKPSAPPPTAFGARPTTMAYTLPELYAKRTFGAPMRRAAKPAAVAERQQAAARMRVLQRNKERETRATARVVAALGQSRPTSMKPSTTGRASGKPRVGFDLTEVVTEEPLEAHWMEEHPALFGGSPDAPNVKQEDAPPPRGRKRIHFFTPEPAETPKGPLRPPAIPLATHHAQVWGMLEEMERERDALT